MTVERIDQLSLSYGEDDFVIQGADLTVPTLVKLVSLWQTGTTPRRKPPMATKLYITPIPLEGQGNIMLLLTVTQKCGMTLDPRDAQGNPAGLDGVPVWTSSDDTIATVTAEADGLTATVVAAGKVGTAQVNVTADARMGPDVVPLAGVLDVQIQSSEAVTLGITTGTPEEQTTAAPTKAR